MVARQRELVARHPASELARFSLAKALADGGQPGEAGEHLEFCLGRKPDWMVAWMLRARCAEATGDRVAARAAFAKALELAIAQDHEGPRAELEAVLANWAE